MKKLLALLLAGLTCLNMSMTVLAQETSDEEGNNNPSIEVPGEQDEPDEPENNVPPVDESNPVDPCEESLPGGADECF